MGTSKNGFILVNCLSRVLFWNFFGDGGRKSIRIVYFLPDFLANCWFWGGFLLF
jgi:hypothetical protein